MSSHAGARQIAHTDGPHVAMPLGGIGTGRLALGAAVSLRQWQPRSTDNHRGDLPGSVCAPRVAQWEPPLNELRAQQAPPPESGSAATPLVNDDEVPQWQRNLLIEHQGVQSTTFTGTYPFATIDYHDDALPVQLSLEAFTPLV